MLCTPSRAISQQMKNYSWKLECRQKILPVIIQLVSINTSMLIMVSFCYSALASYQENACSALPGCNFFVRRWGGHPCDHYKVLTHLKPYSRGWMKWQTTAALIITALYTTEAGALHCLAMTKSGYQLWSTDSKTSWGIQLVQLNDKGINPVLECVEKSSNKRAWKEVAQYSQITKSYICYNFHELKISLHFGQRKILLLYELFLSPQRISIMK